MTEHKDVHNFGPEEANRMRLTDPRPIKSETATYTVEVILSTTEGELPDHEDVEKLIRDQMSGELDETTGLFCIDVHLKKYNCK